MNGSAIAIAAAVLFILVMLWQSMRANIRAASAHMELRADPVEPRGDQDSPSASASRRERVCETLDLRQFLCAVQSTYEPTLARHGLRLELEVPSMPLTVAVREADLRRVFAHIVREVCSAPAVGATLRVLARSDGAQAVINCLDAGGPEPVLPRILATHGDGVPAAVATCRAIVEDFGGRLYAAPSPLGQQSLTLRFPLLRLHDRAEGTP
ncbi:hypothetical protein [Variovorax sp. YR216]|uniref:hypothetical protein n=1 Tax=Variovorax sp. YR216 TaxID=1882828 RepID=UPI00089B77DB|nr:hypothetical protein [Variovorax sp. YR216]SEA16117.1 hypothetical protein SAMN05444680_101729 [Variovorax sp. YR216]